MAAAVKIVLVHSVAQCVVVIVVALVVAQREGEGGRDQKQRLNVSHIHGSSNTAVVQHHITTTTPPQHR